MSWPRAMRRSDGASVAKTAPFDRHHGRYEDWFDRHRAAYISELLAVRLFVPWVGRGLEIGVGTARFAGPLGVRVGVDPSIPMLARAAARGVQGVAGVAEALPFASQSFDYALVVTTICFVDSPEAMLAEALRVLRPGAPLVIGFIDRESALGQHYLARQAESVFYRDAVFHSAADVDGLLRRARFRVRAWGQTLTRPLPDITEVEPLHPGTGRGAFVVVAADRPDVAEDMAHGGLRR
jgi:SAM-dependent methyltransferase